MGRGPIIGDAIEATPQNVFCSRCHSKLRVRPDTNGDGGAIDLVDPCPTCMRRPSAFVLRSTRPPEPGNVRHGTCSDCGHGFEHRRFGRLPARCPRCTEKKYLVCANCRGHWWAKRTRGRYRKVCPSCLKSEEA